jgi:energy-coupling factor transporter ATP-binding protein EcfA2
MQQLIKSNDRVFIAGQTGSGKTTAARHLLRLADRLIVIDPKYELGGPEWNLVDSDRSNMRDLENGKAARLRFTPPPDMPEDFYKSIFLFAQDAGNVIIYIDEMYAVFPGGTRATDPLTMIWTRGRSLGVGTWGATQRPTWVPLFSMSEAQHYFSFRLMLNEDRARMASMMGPEVEGTIKDQYGFWYRDIREPGPKYFKELEVKV